MKVIKDVGPDEASKKLLKNLGANEKTFFSAYSRENNKGVCRFTSLIYSNHHSSHPKQVKCQGLRDIEEN
jgi:hypothetical protein